MSDPNSSAPDDITRLMAYLGNNPQTGFQDARRFMETQMDLRPESAKVYGEMLSSMDELRKLESDSVLIALKVIAAELLGHANKNGKLELDRLPIALVYRVRKSMRDGAVTREQGLGALFIGLSIYERILFEGNSRLVSEVNDRFNDMIIADFSKGKVMPSAKTAYNDVVAMASHIIGILTGGTRYILLRRWAGYDIEKVYPDADAAINALRTSMSEVSPLVIMNLLGPWELLRGYLDWSKERPGEAQETTDIRAMAYSLVGTAMTYKIYKEALKGEKPPTP